MDNKILTHFAVLEACTTCINILQRQQDALKNDGYIELAELADKALEVVGDMYQKAGVDMPDEFWGKDG